MTNPYAHIETAIQMYRAACAFWDETKQRRTDGLAAATTYGERIAVEAEYTKDKAHIGVLLNDLLNHFMTAFPLTAKHNDPNWAAHLDECRKVFYGVKQDGTSACDISSNNPELSESGYDFCQRMYDIPPTILQEIIVVACMRDALAARRMPMPVKNMPAWNAFAERYRDVILKA